MKIVVMTCDKYSWIIPLFKYFCGKYWPDNPYQIEMITETKPVDGTAFYMNHPSWSTRLINYLKQSSDDKFLITLEDYLIKSTVDTFRVNLAEKLCEGNVGCVRLSNVPYKYFRKHTAHSFPINGFREYPLHERFSMVAHMAFYKKQFLLDVLQDGEDIWETENEGSIRLAKMKSKWKVLWPEINIINYPHTGILKKGILLPEELRWLDSELSSNEKIYKIIKKKRNG